jgi:CheY-like chemotaxis protein
MRILVVDDERECGFLLFRMLERLGHDPVLAFGGEHALRILAEDVGAVITDIEMPGMSGIELAQLSRARYGDMPIVFCTGSADGDVTRAAAEIGPVFPKIRSVDDARALIAKVSTFEPRRRASISTR